MVIKICTTKLLKESTSVKAGVLFCCIMEYRMQWAKNKNGFTIVELLIVVVVIAILATITIVAYNGIVGRAKSVAIANSLRNTSDMMEIAIANNPSQTTLPSTVKADKDVVLSLANAPAGEYCVNAYRISAWEVSSYSSRDGSIKPYLCPGAVIGSPVGGTVPNPPARTSLIGADFSTWTLTGGVTYDSSTKELTFSGTGGTASSPLVRMAGASPNAYIAFDIYSATGSVQYAPLAGSYMGAAYFAADGVTPAMSSAGYTTNGNAQSVPLSTWTTRSWTVATGANVQYVRFNINLSPVNYTSNNFKARNPIIEAR